MQIFDVITATNKPDNLPLDPMHIIYQWQGYGGSHTTEEYKDYENTIPEDYLRSGYVEHNLTNQIPRYYSIDFEQWPIHNVTPEIQQRNLNNLKDTFDLIREILPRRSQITFYNTGALPDGRLTDRLFTHEKYLQWQAKNDVLIGVAADYDFMQPSMYIQTTQSIDMWKAKAELYISEHQRVGNGKPVIAHLCPQYIDDHTRLVSGGIWREKLEFCRDMGAGGISIWSYPQVSRRMTWDDNAPWWLETLVFMGI